MPSGLRNMLIMLPCIDKADAKVEEIEKAVEDLKADIIDYGYSVATEDNPLDVTEKFVKEPSFANSTERMGHHARFGCQIPT